MTVTEVLEKKFKKVCVNATRAYDVKEVDGKMTKVPMLFRRGDLTKWAQEAFDRGENYFYHKPVDPLAPYGPQMLCEPEYRYQLKTSLTIEEYKQLLDTVKTAERTV